MINRCLQLQWITLNKFAFYEKFQVESNHTKSHRVLLSYDQPATPGLPEDQNDQTKRSKPKIIQKSRNLRQMEKVYKTSIIQK